MPFLKISPSPSTPKRRHSEGAASSTTTISEPSTPSKPTSKSPSKSGITISPASMKLLPAKLGRKVSRQFRRLTSFNGHVTLPKHRELEPGHADPFAAPSSPSHPSIFPDVVRDILPPPLTSAANNRSGNSEDTFAETSKFVKESYIQEINLGVVRNPSSDCFSSLHSSASTSTPSVVSSTEMSLDSHLQTSHPLGDSQPMSAVTEASEPEAPVTSSTSEISDPSEQQAQDTYSETYVEPEVPDPFLMDEEGDALSDNGRGVSPLAMSESQHSLSPAHEISLTAPTSPPSNTDTLPSPLVSANVNKDVPPPPSTSSESEEAPDLYLPGLVIPTMFLPIPNTDPLTTLLTKYIYPPERRPVRDVTGDWQRADFHTLVMTNSWRALARMARDRLVTTDPADLNTILGLWHLRLSCLARLRLFNQTSAECTNLFVVLNAIEPLEAREWVFERVLPFELEVMNARLKYWAGDHMGYLDALSALLRKCRIKSKQAKGDEETVSMWKERGARVSLIIASQMVEMKEYTAAAKSLEQLCNSREEGTTIPPLRSAIARVYLQGGNVGMAAKHFSAVEADPTADESQKKMNAALLASAQGEWEEATNTLKEILEKDSGNFAAVNDLSVALLSQGKLKEGIAVLEKALQASPSSVVVAEPFLFNLSTLYELRATAGIDKKRDLLIEVAKWSGDGLRTSCLKMPTN